MADYVRETMLCQGYAHIDAVPLTPQQAQDYAIQVRAYQEPRARLFFGEDVIPEVRTKDGSIVVYTTVYGSLSKLIKRPANFAKEIDELYGSSKMLAEAFIVESLFLSRVPKSKLIRSEARTGVIRSIKELFDRVSGAIATFETDSAKSVIRQLDFFEARIPFLNAQLRSLDDRKLVWASLTPTIRRLPLRPNAIQRLKDEGALSSYQGRVRDLQKQVADFSNATE